MNSKEKKKETGE